MNRESMNDGVAEEFRRNYQRIIETAPAGESWPLSPTGRGERRGRRSPPVLRSAPLAFGLATLLAFATGWLMRPLSALDEAMIAYQSSPPTTALAVPMEVGSTFDTPGEAAIDAATRQSPGLSNPGMRMVVIYAGTNLIDLRVKLEADNFCQWYGVTGRVTEGELRWSGYSPGQDC